MEKKKNIKIIVILLACFLIYMFLMFLLISKNKGTSGYILNSGIGSFYCENAKCESVSDSDVSTGSQSFAVYQYNEYVDNYQVNYNMDTWNFFQNNSWKAIYGDYLAIDTSLDFEYLPYEMVPLSGSEENMIQSRTKISYTALNRNNVYTLDLDNNGVTDRLYALSNQTEEEENNDYFSIFFVEINGDLQPIYINTVQDADGYSLPYYNVAGVLKIDGVLKIILNKGFFSSHGVPETILLTFDGERFVEETENE